MLWVLIIVLMWHYGTFQAPLSTIHHDLAEKHAAQGLHAPEDPSEVDVVEDPISSPIPLSTASGVTAPLTAPPETEAIIDEDADGGGPPGSNSLQ